MQDNRDKDVGVFGVDTSTNFGRNFIDACMEIIKSTNANTYLRYNITRVITEAVWKLCYQRNVSMITNLIHLLSANKFRQRASSLHDV